MRGDNTGEIQATQWPACGVPQSGVERARKEAREEQSPLTQCLSIQKNSYNSKNTNFKTGKELDRHSSKSHKWPTSTWKEPPCH